MNDLFVDHVWYSGSSLHHSFLWVWSETNDQIMLLEMFNHHIIGVDVNWKGNFANFGFTDDKSTCLIFIWEEIYKS